ncbi:MAG: NAD+ synthase [Nitrososphaeria archaeon]|nr:NAD+ synthase [Nitrososphaeria archaeon]NDB63430.1 NAD+ synthase [Nitrosopumilaceae archaeon]NDB90595.1 NAD+ synthase [Nitrososphaerota archaeon]NDB47137.1 NAD+ synthase [Nitrososphaeria archaeon]NDF26940.1 NAD+ synthase [Nitrosopumilaceae archaeon]
MLDSILKEITSQDYSKIQNDIETFLAKHLQQSKGFVFGLSGGIDSAVIAHVCAKSFKEKSLALIMPDSKISPKEETEDALYTVDKLGIDYKLIDINMIHSQFGAVLEQDQRALGNLRARIRANLLYYYANMKNYLVLGSSDKSEYLIGYFTKFGDGSSDIMPIASLYKTQVRQLAKYLDVKESIISKKSSPHLWKNHLAEDELGIPYEQIDCILYCIVDKKMSVSETQTTTNISADKIQKINQLHINSEHKRSTPSKL